jgi:hypothetical protein
MKSSSFSRRLYARGNAVSVVQVVADVDASEHLTIDDDHARSLEAAASPD